MSAVKVIISFAMLGFFLWFTIVAIQNYMVTQQELEKAQKEYDIAAAEFAASNKELDNVVKYGCANPVVSPGLVSCPNE
jgi:maleate cis-trans isomerase